MHLRKHRRRTDWARHLPPLHEHYSWGELDVPASDSSSSFESPCTSNDTLTSVVVRSVSLPPSSFLSSSISSSSVSSSSASSNHRRHRAWSTSNSCYEYDQFLQSPQPSSMTPVELNKKSHREAPDTALNNISQSCSFEDVTGADDACTCSNANIRVHPYTQGQVSNAQKLSFSDYAAAELPDLAILFRSILPPRPLTPPRNFSRIYDSMLVPEGTAESHSLSAYDTPIGVRPLRRKRRRYTLLSHSTMPRSTMPRSTITRSAIPLPRIIQSNDVSTTSADDLTSPNPLNFELFDSRDFEGSHDSNDKVNQLSTGGQLDKEDNPPFLLPGRIRALFVTMSHCTILFIEKIIPR